MWIERPLWAILSKKIKLKKKYILFKQVFLYSLPLILKLAVKLEKDYRK